MNRTRDVSRSFGAGTESFAEKKKAARVILAAFDLLIGDSL
jgi:hypothetical protein